MRKRRLHHAPAIFLSILLVGVAGYLLGWSKSLAIKSIEISAAGNESTVQPLIIPGDVHVGMPMARVSVKRIEHDLSQFTWIKKIHVNRRWLAHDLRITITERLAVAQYTDQSGATQYFDASGVNFSSPNPPSGIPTITFAGESTSSRSSVATFLSQTPVDLTAHLVSLSVDQSNGIKLTTSITGFKALTISWGEAVEIPLKVKVLRQLLTLPENKKITFVDLSSPLTPLVK